MSERRFFQMRLVDIFFLEDKTVFVGRLETEQSFLGPAACRLVINGVERARLDIEGESLFRPDLESVWTRERPDVSREEVVSAEAWLISM